MEKRTRREYTKEFKQQMVALHGSGKPASEIIREYELTASTFHKWVKQFNKTESFKVDATLVNLFLSKKKFTNWIYSPFMSLLRNIIY